MFAGGSDDDEIVCVGGGGCTRGRRTTLPPSSSCKLDALCAIRLHPPVPIRVVELPPDPKLGKFSALDSGILLLLPCLRIASGFDQPLNEVCAALNVCPRDMAISSSTMANAPNARNAFSCCSMDVSKFAAKACCAEASLLLLLVVVVVVVFLLLLLLLPFCC